MTKSIGFGAYEFHVRSGGVEVGVVGDDVSFFAHHAEKDALGGSPLVSGDDVLVAEDILHGAAELLEAAAAGITFVALHHGRPLVRGHGAGPGIGEEVDEDVVRGQKKKIVERGAEQVLALRAGGPVNGFDALDAEGFDDGARHGGFSL